MPQVLKRRNISNIYIFDQFPGEDHRRPTCIEDCSPSRRKEWLMTKDKNYLRSVIQALSESFKELTDYCHKEGAIKDEYKTEFIQMADGWMERSKWNWAEHEMADQIDVICSKIIMFADAVGVTRRKPEKTENDSP